MTFDIKPAHISQLVYHKRLEPSYKVSQLHIDVRLDIERFLLELWQRPSFAPRAPSRLRRRLRAYNEMNVQYFLDVWEKFLSD